ncbi:hydrogenase maturation protease [Amycolatopsis sp. H20-H5]|uniref:hydrogenase maturation protease n=1 Tax=Amycolatopsis sp. H20-H5 TaxID=3046309 RepID=UPI002DB6FAF7|nr:hydrogenase maturation protease [Amycolatopsis sp. H20-H5]MEC3981706.1 hydrogenase maturation protease [Amycolatopsis sp. H20-H5]
MTRPRVLVAGIGNIFLGDDGFGVEVIKELEGTELPEWVQIADYGISGMHLAYDLLGGYDTTILIDATPRGEAPGTVYLIEADTEELSAGSAVDAHGMQPEAVFQLLRMLGGDAGRVLVVGCEPANLDSGIGLSAAVEAAVPEAVRVVTELAWGTSPHLSEKKEKTEV